MSSKLSPDGKYIPFQGWTIISPVRPANPNVEPANRLRAQSQALWSSFLSQALHIIASHGPNFAPLPVDSMHMTITGLSEVSYGTFPADKVGAPPQEIEATLIQRCTEYFTQSHLRSVANLEMTFTGVHVGSVVSLEFETATPEMQKDVDNWKAKILTSARLDPLKKPSMPFHITLAYRVKGAGQSIEQELKKQVAAVFGKPPNLLLNPPALCCYEDMTRFPTVPLFPENRPLSFLLEGHYGAALVKTLPREKSVQIAQPSQVIQSLEKPVCVVLVLGRALEGGRVSLTLEHRLCRGYQVFVEAKSSGLYSQVLFMFSGGFTAGCGDRSEAGAMQDWLMTHFAGISEQDVILEESSLTTVENALFVRRLLREKFEGRKVGSVKIVTTQSHMPRTVFTFNNLLLPDEDQHYTTEFYEIQDGDPLDVLKEREPSRQDHTAVVRRHLLMTTFFLRQSILESVKRNNPVELLERLQSRADTDLNKAMDEKQNTLLHLAVAQRRYKIVPLLLERGASVTIQNKAQETPIDVLLSSHGDVKILDQLLNAWPPSELPSLNKRISALSISRVPSENLVSSAGATIMLDMRQKSSSSLFLIELTSQYEANLNALLQLMHQYYLYFRQEELSSLILDSPSARRAQELFESAGVPFMTTHPPCSSQQKLLDALSSILKSKQPSVTLAIVEAGSELHVRVLSLVVKSPPTALVWHLRL